MGSSVRALRVKGLLIVIKRISGIKQPLETVEVSVSFTAGAGKADVVERRARREVRMKVCGGYILRYGCHFCSNVVGRVRVVFELVGDGFIRGESVGFLYPSTVGCIFDDGCGRLQSEYSTRGNDYEGEREKIFRMTCGGIQESPR